MLALSSLHAMHSLCIHVHFSILFYTISVVLLGSLSLRLPILLLFLLFSAPATGISPRFPCLLADLALDSRRTLMQQQPHLVCNSQAINREPDPIHINASIDVPTLAWMLSSGWPPSTFCMMKNMTVAMVVAAMVNKHAKKPTVPIVNPTQQLRVFGRRFSDRSKLNGKTRAYKAANPIPTMKNPNMALLANLMRSRISTISPGSWIVAPDNNSLSIMLTGLTQYSGTGLLHLSGFPLFSPT